MLKTSPVPVKLLEGMLGVVAAWSAVSSATAWGQQEARPDFKAEFLQLCDVAAEELNQEPRRAPRHKAFYADSYAVRALAVGYDITGNEKYLDACKAWSDRMVDLQSKMIPPGAYSMNYGRQPGQDHGGWYVADSSSIAMGVLATAVRCKEKAEKDRYLDSVRSFARLVIENYVGPNGGITDGLWETYDGEWWCSSGLFGSLAFLLYKETGDETYLEVALGALDWLNRLEFQKVKHISFDEAAPAVVMYVFEAHSASMPYLEEGTKRREETVAQIGRAVEWMSKNQKGPETQAKWDYNSQWGSKLGGLPFHMYVYSRHMPEFRELRLAADRELGYVSRLVFGAEKPRLSQLVVFSLMSYAERVSPGSIYRGSGLSRMFR